MRDTLPHASALVTWPSHAPFRRADDRNGAFPDHLTSVSLTALLAVDLLMTTPPDRSGARQMLRKASRELRRVKPCAETRLVSDVTRMVRRILEGASSAVLAPPLLAWAFLLEHDHQSLERALDVTQTVIAISGHNVDEAELIAALLQHARVLRKLSRYDQALLSYRLAEAMAEKSGDGHSVRLCRIGCAKIVTSRGDLPRAERLLQGVLEEAVTTEDRDAEGRANLDLALLSLVGERGRDAVRYSYQVVERATQARMRVDGFLNLGVGLKLLGHYSPAIEALEMALTWSVHPEEKINILSELIECCGRLGDRVRFARCERDLTRFRMLMMPEQRIDSYLRRGIALSCFGETEAAREALEVVMREAEEHQLNALWFQAERSMKRLAEAPVEHVPAPSMDVETARIAGRLHAMRVEGAQQVWEP